MDNMKRLEGLVPDRLQPKTRKIVLDEYVLSLDIGFHDSEIGNPQRVLISAEIWVDAASFASNDQVADAWNYDTLRTDIARLASQRRYDLQEALVRDIYDMIAARRGVTALKVASAKPDIYPDCKGVGVELSSF